MAHHRQKLLFGALAGLGAFLGVAERGFDLFALGDILNGADDVGEAAGPVVQGGHDAARRVGAAIAPPVHRLTAPGASGLDRRKDLLKLIVRGVGGGQHAHRLSDDLLPPPTRDGAKAGVHLLNPPVGAGDDESAAALFGRLGQFANKVDLFELAAKHQQSPNRNSQQQPHPAGGPQAADHRVPPPVVRGEIEHQNVRRTGPVSNRRPFTDQRIAADPRSG